jgi:diadenosine tetraphosphate (Ap4A) HIT family hydrolase
MFERYEIDWDAYHQLYLLSLGSNQGNAHVHWHIVPLPAGVPYREQQLGIYRKGILKIPEEEMAALAARLAKRIETNG